jgi:hypothetical protein
LDRLFDEIKEQPDGEWEPWILLFERGRQKASPGDGKPRLDIQPGQVIGSDDAKEKRSNCEDLDHWRF